MDDEAAFLRALEEVVAVRLEGDALALLDADGGTQVQLVRPGGRLRVRVARLGLVPQMPARSRSR